MTTNDEQLRKDQTDAVSELRRANDWIKRAKILPMPKKLFGEFWQTGELAMLFGDTGTGKSALALQIADSIARGRPIEPFEMTAAAQNVVYVDLEMTGKQFESRYASENVSRDAQFLRGHHRFSQRCWRVELDLAEGPAAGGPEFVGWFRQKIEGWIKTSGASVIILDNITYLKRGFYGALDVLPVMQMLNSLRKWLDMSILVIAHTPKRETSRPLDLADLLGSKVLAKFAGSVFGVGHSRRETSGRYIKQVRAHGGTVLFDASHVPAFRIRKLGGNFLGFEFERFEPENDLLNDIRGHREWETIDRIKRLTDEGLSIRAIAAQIEMPRSTVHYLLKMWRPPVRDGEAESGSPPYAVGGPTGNTGGSVTPERGVAGPTPSVGTDGVVLSDNQRDGDFPGCKEYDEAMDDARFEDLYMDEDDEEYDAEEQRRLNRESYLIELARADARRAYEATGVTPRLHDHPKYLEFLECVAAGKDPFADNEASPLDVRESSAFPDSPEEFLGGSASSGGIAAKTFPASDGKAQLFRTTDGTAAELKPSRNAYGREIFVEKEDERGRPVIWYSYDADGNRYQHERTRYNSIVIRPASKGGLTPLRG